MGQYHIPVNMTANAYLDTHMVGCGLKAWESCSGGVPAALVALLSYQPSSASADIRLFGTGQWAGDRLLVVGDYAQDDDIVPFEGPFLSDLYGLCRQGASNDTAGFAKLQNRSPLAAGLIEYATSVRFIGDGWLADIPVDETTDENGIQCWAPKLELDLKLWPYSQIPRYLELNQKPWNRPPRQMHTPLPPLGDVADGQRRLFANLDRREFFDPERLGAPVVATTQGLMQAACRYEKFSAAGALYAMLLHPEPRGGGDILPNEFPEIGRWRNNHLWLTANQTDERFPGTQDVRSAFTDITDAVAASMALADLANA